MPLRIEDKDWIKETIHAEVKEYLNPHGWRKLQQIIPLGAVIGVFVACLALAAAGWYNAISNGRDEAKFQEDTKRDLADLKGAVKDIQEESAKQGLFNHAALPLSDFKATLPTLSTAIATAKKQDVKVDPKVLDDLQEKLIASGKDAPGFWPTTAAFISYRSQSNVSEVQDLLVTELPLCADHAPIPMEVRKTSNENGKPLFRMISAFYDNCRITLDSTEEASAILSLMKHDAFELTFRHCQIIWHGGQINLLMPPDSRAHPHLSAITTTGGEPTGVAMVTGRGLLFKNCLIAFTLSAPPPPESQEFAQLLLAQNGPSLEILSPWSGVHS
jgi:hypothetical protein